MSATDTTGAPEAAPEDLKLVLPGRGTPAGAGWDWIVQGWRLFARAPLMWILSLLILFILAAAVSLIPFLGSLLFQLVQAVLAGGFMVACRSLEKGGEFELEHLFAGFQRRFVPLLVVGLLFMLGWIVILLVFAMFAGFAILGAVLAGDPNNIWPAIAASAGSLMLGTLVVLALMVPLMAAYWFAPALVMMHDVAPVAAMKESLVACLRNFVPFLVYGLVMFVALIIAAIPFGLGLLVWVPVAITSTYAAYRQIFTEDAGTAVAPSP